MSEHTPLISVVTVCRNCRDMLAKTARSVGEQTFGDFEYIVVDGASTDGTAGLLHSGEVKADRFVSEPDRGIYDAMNKGVGLSRGRWIVFMNAGDTFADPETLSRVAGQLDASGSDIVYGDALLDRDGKLTEKAGLEPANRHRMFFHHQSAYTRRQWLERFPFRLDVGLSGDFCFFKECILAGAKFCHIADSWCVYDCTGASTKGRMEVIRANIRVIRRFDNLANRLRFLPRLYFVVWWNAIFKRKNHA